MKARTLQEADHDTRLEGLNPRAATTWTSLGAGSEGGARPMKARPLQEADPATGLEVLPPRAATTWTSLGSGSDSVASQRAFPPALTCMVGRPRVPRASAVIGLAAHVWPPMVQFAPG